MKPPLRRFVLVGPAGKQAGLRAQALIAIQIHSVEMSRNDLGGGIASLALPHTVHEWKRLFKLQTRGYSIKTVQARAKSRGSIRDAVTTPLLVVLAEAFIVERGASHRVMAAPVREFSKWICEKLSSRVPNKVRTIVATAHPDLVDRTKSDWWMKRISQRKK